MRYKDITTKKLDFWEQVPLGLKEKSGSKGSVLGNYRKTNMTTGTGYVCNISRWWIYPCNIAKCVYTFATWWSSFRCCSCLVSWLLPVLRTSDVLSIRRYARCRNKNAHYHEIHAACTVWKEINKVNNIQWKFFFSIGPSAMMLHLMIFYCFPQGVVVNNTFFLKNFLQNSLFE